MARSCMAIMGSDGLNTFRSVHAKAHSIIAVVVGPIGAAEFHSGTTREGEALCGLFLGVVVVQTSRNEEKHHADHDVVEQALGFAAVPPMPAAVPPVS